MELPWSAKKYGKEDKKKGGFKCTDAPDFIREWYDWGFFYLVTFSLVSCKSLSSNRLIKLINGKNQ